MMKKFVIAILALMLCIAVTCCCAEEPVRVLAMKGPTAMGMVEMMDAPASEYVFTLEAAVDAIAPQLVQGRVDIAAVPANLAAVLYNQTKGDVRVIAINTLGVLYVIERGDTIHSVEDLRGRTIYASGKGATPEYALHYILAGNGLDPDSDVSIEWKSEHSECLSALLNDERAIAMLPQPFVTTAQMKTEGLRIALDLTEAWNRLQEGSDSASSMITGVAVARREFIETQPEKVTAFLDRYAHSVTFVQEHVEEAAELIGQYGIVPAQVASRALPYCNITLIEGDSMREKLSGYLAVLFEQNPRAVGGAMPGEDFYYHR